MPLLHAERGRQGCDLWLTTLITVVAQIESLITQETVLSNGQQVVIAKIKVQELGVRTEFVHIVPPKAYDKKEPS